jgi:hypothetical protein
MYNIETYIKNRSLTKVIRGEECIYTTPAEINAERKPTDHNVLLEKGIYPLIGRFSVKELEDALEKALKDSCIDALGTFCAIQLFYSEIVNEEFDSPLKINEKKLPLILGKAFSTYENGLKNHDLFGKNSLGKVWELAATYIMILNRDYNIDFGLKIK